MPSSITVSAGYSNAGLIFSTAAVTSQTQVTVTGSYNQVQYSPVLTVTLKPTTTILTSSPDPSSYGQSVTFTAKVTSTYGSPTGSVTFYDSGTPIYTGMMIGGQASFTSFALTGGSHSIQAVYNGAGTFSPSSSSSIVQSINKDASTSAVISSHNPSIYGQPVTFTATVSSGSGTPTGTVTFKDGATTLGVASLSGGHAALATSSLIVGTHPITVAYSGDANFNASTSTAVSQVVEKATSAISLSSSANSAEYNASVTFTAKFTSPSGAVATGAVTFKDGATTLGTGTLSSDLATFTTTKLAIGAHSITADFAGNANIAASTSAALTQTVNKAASTTALAASLNPSIFNQAVAFTATVKSATTGTPTGTVTFKDGATTLSTVTLNSSGVAAFSISTLGVATHSITAVYSGSADFNASTSAALSHIVNKDSSKISLTASLNPSLFNQSVSFTATVKSATTGTPTGTVVFKDAATTLSTVTLNASGVANFSTTSLIVGTHSITAVYSGSTDFAASTSAVLSHIVNKDASTTALTVSPSPSEFNQSVTMTATVKSSTTGVPTGTVTFKDGATTLSTVTLNSSGIAVLAKASFTAGNHTITAVYSGNTDLLTSTSPAVTLSVKAAATTTKVTSSANPSKAGKSVTFTATVTPAFGGSPSGTVTFKNGTVTLGTASVNSTTHTATFATTTLTQGTHSITAVYGGNTDFTASTSSALSQVVNP